MEKKIITFADIKQSEEIRAYIKQADISLAARGFTEHSFAHVTKCAEVAGKLLEDLGYNAREVELVKIAAFMHDIGNVVNRADHAQSGALMAFRILDKMGLAYDETAMIISAIGNHDEGSAYPVNEIAAALILADKSDVRRTRVRNKNTTLTDIHDRVNYAVEKADLILDKEDKTLTLYLTIDTKVSAIMDYFEIFLARYRVSLCLLDFLFIKAKPFLNSRLFCATAMTGKIETSHCGS